PPVRDASHTRVVLDVMTTGTYLVTSRVVRHVLEPHLDDEHVDDWDDDDERAHGLAKPAPPSELRRHGSFCDHSPPPESDHARATGRPSSRGGCGAMAAALRPGTIKREPRRPVRNVHTHCSHTLTRRPGCARYIT